MKSDTQIALNHLGSLPWLTRHAPDVPALLVREGRIDRLVVGQWVQAEGDVETGLLILIQGALDLFCQGPNDRIVQFDRVGPGATLGQSIRFGGGPRQVTAVCAEASLVLRVGDGALIRIADQFPSLWSAVAALQNTNLRYMLRVITEFIDLPPRRRLAARLNRLAGRERDPRPVHISQQGLAEMLGCTRKTVTGYLSEFEKLNLITVGYTRIDIRDREGLRKIATAK